MNDLPDFIRALLDGQPLLLPQWTPITKLDESETAKCIEQFESEYRLQLPFSPPGLSIDHAVWTARTFYTASHFVVHRTESPELVLEMLRSDPPAGSRSSEVHYSVDLIFRFLPGLLEQAHARSHDDVLVSEIKRLAAAWPLSSVGMRDIAVETVEPIASHDCLLQLYVDRIVDKQDWSRLDDNRVRERLRVNLGQFGDLAPEAVAAIEDRE